MNLIEQLRTAESLGGSEFLDLIDAGLLHNAADEIERLQSEIEQLLKAHAAYEQAITKIEDEWHHV